MATATATATSALATLAAQAEELAQTPAGVAFLGTLATLALECEQQASSAFANMGKSIFATLENDFTSAEQFLLLKTNAGAADLWGKLANVAQRKPATTA